MRALSWKQVNERRKKEEEKSKAKAKEKEQPAYKWTREEQLDAEMRVQ